jgi:predicted nucleotidyltransferase
MRIGIIAPPPQEWRHYDSTGRFAMARPTLPKDFSEFLKLLNDHHVEYLLIGGYAVAFHGYPRTTADMDVWVALNQENADRLVEVLAQFGIALDDSGTCLFLTPGNIVRMGLPPMRLKVLNEIDGVDFSECFERRVTDHWDGIEVPIISLADLRTNKLASGRHKDLDDLEHLPE